MKIYGICLVKNEIDIISSCLIAASKWADKIFVLDNASTDGTWEVVQDLSKQYSQIVAWRSDPTPYHDGLRADAFNAFRAELSTGDWFAFIDADEFMVDNPREFLKSVPRIYHQVKTKAYEYGITVEDLEEHEFQNDFEKDKHILKYYRPQAYSEIRFIRYRKRLSWTSDERIKFPKYAGVIYPKHIMLKHYQYRSPHQIQKRIEIRQKVHEYHPWFKRDLVDSWKDILRQRSDMIFETESMVYKTFKDPNIIPWYRNVERLVMHALRIYP